MQQNNNSILKDHKNILEHFTRLPHTQETQGIQGNPGNFQVEENISETQGILIYFLNSGKF